MPDEVWAAMTRFDDGTIFVIDKSYRSSVREMPDRPLTHAAAGRGQGKHIADHRKAACGDSLNPAPATPQ